MNLNKIFLKTDRNLCPYFSFTHEYFANSDGPLDVKIQLWESSKISEKELGRQDVHKA